MSTQKVPIAKFRLKRYLITNIIAKFSGNEPNGKMSLMIDPNGTLDLDKKIFNLILDIIVCDEDKNMELKMSIIGFFEYDTTDIALMCNYISINSPAILFPYVRAYVSNITALSGMFPIIIPTSNMETVGKELFKKLREKHPNLIRNSSK